MPNASKVAEKFVISARVKSAPERRPTPIRKALAVLYVQMDIAAHPSISYQLVYLWLGGALCGLGFRDGGAVIDGVALVVEGVDPFVPVPHLPSDNLFSAANLLPAGLDAQPDLLSLFHTKYLQGLGFDSESNPWVRLSHIRDSPAFLQRLDGRPKPRQLAHVPDADARVIAECCQHIVISAPAFRQHRGATTEAVKKDRLCHLVSSKGSGKGVRPAYRQEQATEPALRR